MPRQVVLTRHRIRNAIRPPRRLSRGLVTATDDVDDPLVRRTHPVQRDAELGAVLLQLSELRGQENRIASYACAAAYANGGEEYVAMGETFGHIVDQPSGDNGFGYDPYFRSAELEKTFGDATTAEKQAISHRGRAFRALMIALRSRSTGI